jgi:hypothetical protein
MLLGGIGRAIESCVKLLTRGRWEREPGVPRTAAGHSSEMPLLNRIRAFLASPQGRRVTEQGRRMASDPRQRERARSLLARLRRR